MCPSLPAFSRLGSVDRRTNHNVPTALRPKLALLLAPPLPPTPPRLSPCRLRCAVVWCALNRWWEARDCWRTIVNEVTHLARQVEQWLPGPERAPLRSALLRWLRVFPLSLMVHLRGHEEDLAGLADKLLQPQESALLLKAPSPPQLVLSAVGQLLAASDARIESKTHCDESVRVLQEAVGGCEKLLTTPLPLSYTRCGTSTTPAIVVVMCLRMTLCMNTPSHTQHTTAHSYTLCHTSRVRCIENHACHLQPHPPPAPSHTARAHRHKGVSHTRTHTSTAAAAGCRLAGTPAAF